MEAVAVSIMDVVALITAAAGASDIVVASTSEEDLEAAVDSMVPEGDSTAIGGALMATEAASMAIEEASMAIEEASMVIEAALMAIGAALMVIEVASMDPEAVSMVAVVASMVRGAALAAQDLGLPVDRLWADQWDRGEDSDHHAFHHMAMKVSEKTYPIKYKIQSL
jgi:hypothetical protein